MAKNTEKLVIDGDEITQALEDVRERYAAPGESQTEKSRRAVMVEIREWLTKHPEKSNKDIALEVGATPKQVAAQRYLMSDKGQAQRERSIEKKVEKLKQATRSERRMPEAVEQAIKEAIEQTDREMETPEVKPEATTAPIDEIIRLWQTGIGVKMTRSDIRMELTTDGCRIQVEYRSVEK